MTLYQVLKKRYLEALEVGREKREKSEARREVGKQMNRNYFLDKIECLTNKSMFDALSYCNNNIQKDSIDYGRTLQERVKGVRYLIKNDICPICNKELENDGQCDFETGELLRITSYCKDPNCSFFFSTYHTVEEHIACINSRLEYI